MGKLSVVISAFNEEKKIEDCLKSVSFADEIIFVDNSSTDKTEEIARKYTENIYEQKNDPSAIDLQKNFGFTKASHEWILSIDADEEVSKKLADEIRTRIKNNVKENGFWIPRKNIIFGKWIEHTGWYPDYQLRLFKKGKGKFKEKHVHKIIKLDGESEKLKSPIIHYNYENISQFLQKMLLYTENEANQLIEKGYNLAWQDSIRFPTKEFVSRFFAREGFKDGLRGLVLSLLMAFYHLVVFVNIWEKLKFKQIEDEKFLSEVKEEFVKGHKEIFFWFLKISIDKTRDPLKKLVLRIKSKISQ